MLVGSVWSVPSSLSRHIERGTVPEEVLLQIFHCTCSLRFRRYFLDSSGIIGLTPRVLLSPVLDALEHLGQLQEIRCAKGGSASRKHDIGVGGMETGPGCWQRADMLGGIIEGDVQGDVDLTQAADKK